MITTNLLSASTVELILEWHNSYNDLDSVNTEIALVHDAIHAWCGLSTSLDDEAVVSNIANMLAGLETLPYLTKRCEFLLSLLPSDVVVELSIACSIYYGN